MRESMRTNYQYDTLDHVLEFISESTPETLTRIEISYSQSDESAAEIIRALNRGEVSLEQVISYGDEVLRIDTTTVIEFASGKAYFSPSEEY